MFHHSVNMRCFARAKFDILLGMHRKKNTRRKQIQLAFVYALMVLSVLSIVTVLILVIQGYRYNRFDGKVEQGGLVQFDSRPSGATVTLDGVPLANRTASRLTVSSGQHVVTMTRPGYSTWKKTVTVKPGTVLWLNYSRLFPDAPTVTTPLTLTGVASALASPDRKTFALVQDAKKPIVSVIEVDSDTPKLASLQLDSTLLTSPTTGSHSYGLVAWDGSSRYVLVKHTYAKSKSEYLSVDTTGRDKPRNISAALGVSVAQIGYKIDDANVVYILTTSGEIRTANLSANTLSGPLVSRASSLSTANRFVTYVTQPDSKGMRTVGYLSSGASKAKTVQTFSATKDASLQFEIGDYYGDRFAIVAHGTKAAIYQADLPSSDSTSDASMKQLAEYAFSKDVRYAGFSPTGNRMIYMQTADTIKTHDLELDAASDLKLLKQPSQRVTWMDGFHIMNTAGGDFYYYDFDGTNGQLVAHEALDTATMLSQGDKYLYYFTQSGTNVLLTRVQMLPN